METAPNQAAGAGGFAAAQQQSRSATMKAGRIEPVVNETSTEVFDALLGALASIDGGAAVIFDHVSQEFDLW